MKIRINHHHVEEFPIEISPKNSRTLKIQLLAKDSLIQLSRKILIPQCLCERLVEELT